MLKPKEQAKSKSPSALALIQSETVVRQHEQLTELPKDVDYDFKPFVTQGLFSLTGCDRNNNHSRDTSETSLMFTLQVVLGGW